MNLPSSIQELANLSSIVGLLISVVGLAISIWVLVNTLRLKAQFKLLIGLPRLLNKLTDNAAKLVQLSRKFASSRHLIRAELNKIEANIESVKEKDEKTDAAVSELQIVIKAYRDDLSNQEKLWEVYCELQGLIEKIENIQEDRLEER